MIATGNIGNYLNDKADQVNTYYTRDGGVTWKEIKKGPYVPEIGDHGSILVLAKTSEDVNEFTYSLDDGYTWNNCVFSDKLYAVENILVSQGWDSRKFVLYGEHQGKVIMAQLDFENSFSRGQCSEANGDFEDWSPTDLHGECVLGKQTIFRRRRQGVDCWFGEDHQHVTNSLNCSCDIHDYECDYCFDRPDVGGPCVFYCTEDAIEIFKLKLASAGACDKTTNLRQVDAGYIKVEEDTCEMLASSIIKPRGYASCNLHQKTVVDELINSPLLTMVAVIAFIVLIGSSVAFCVLRKSPGVQNNVPCCGDPTNYDSVITLTQNVDFSS